MRFVYFLFFFNFFFEIQVLSKTNRVAYGLLLPDDIKRHEITLGVKTSSSRKMLSVPFVGKDEPSATSEFSHPDIRLGLSILSYKYEGIRKHDFGKIISLLKNEMVSKYKSERACIAYMESTVVSIFITFPSFKPVALSLSRSPLF